MLFAHLIAAILQFCAFCKKHQPATNIYLCCALPGVTDTMNKQILQYPSPALLCLLQTFKPCSLQAGPVSSASQSCGIPAPGRVILCISESATVGNRCSPLQPETSGKNSCCASVEKSHPLTMLANLFTNSCRLPCQIPRFK